MCRLDCSGRFQKRYPGAGIALASVGWFPTVYLIVLAGYGYGVRNGVLKMRLVRTTSYNCVFVKAWVIDRQELGI